MSMLYVLKPHKDHILRPLSMVFLAAGISPNMVTAFGLIMSAAAGMLALSGHLYIGIFLFMIGACCDAIDGSFARACGMCSEFGKYFDSYSDRFSELVLITGAVMGGVPVSAFLVAAGSLLLLASRTYNHRKGLNSDAAMFGRPERLALLITGLLFHDPYGTVLFAIAFLLCLVSSVQVLASGAGKKIVSRG